MTQPQDAPLQPVGDELERILISSRTGLDTSNLTPDVVMLVPSLDLVKVKAALNALIDRRIVETLLAKMEELENLCIYKPYDLEATIFNTIKELRQHHIKDSGGDHVQM